MRVLIVDNNPNDRELIKRCLNKAIEHVEFEEVTDYQTFMRCLEQDHYDIVLTDYRLNWSDGLAVLQAVKIRHPYKPVVMVTDSGSEELAAQGMREGLSDYVLKDHLSRLPAAVRDAIERERINREYATAVEELQRSHQALEAALQQLRDTQQQVIQQQRLRALGEMASGIAHDFNNALTPILGLTELLLDDPQVTANPQAKRYLEMIRTAAQDAAHTVSRLREFYRPRSWAESRQMVDLNEIAREVVELTAPLWRQQAQAQGVFIEVHTDLEPLPPVLANGSEMREMLQNLLFNSVDALPKGGMITIRTRFLAEAEPPKVQIEVEDNGIGMDEQTLSRCLEPFFTTKSERGNGLGLSVVYGIVQRHEGDIHISSTLGEGTTVRITLPTNMQSTSSTSEECEQENAKSLRILLVEDKDLVRDVLVEHLLRQGHLVDTANNGMEGLQRFNSARYDLIITDLAMPMMSGEQMALEIKKVAPNKPIILMTGFGERQLCPSRYPHLVDAVLIKPVTLYALRQAIAKVTAE